jgi:chaperonin cofactor prefoldin
MGSSAFGQPMQQSIPQSNDLQKDIQLISLKLDAIKSELDAVNQRLRNIESIAEREQIKPGKKWY